MDKLEQVGRESVPVFLQESSGIVEHHSSEVVEPERGVDIRLGLQVVAVGAVLPVELEEHCLVRAR